MSTPLRPRVRAAVMIKHGLRLTSITPRRDRGELPKTKDDLRK